MKVCSGFHVVFVLLVVLVETNSFLFQDHNIAKRSTRSSCPNFGIYDSPDFNQLSGYWITLNATINFLECYKLRIQLLNETTVILGTAVDIGDGRIFRAVAVCQIKARDKCMFPKEDEDDDEPAYENVVKIIKADPRKYMILNVCMRFSTGRRENRWTEIYVRPDVELGQEEVDAVNTVLRRGRVDPEGMYQIHHDQCNYDFK